MAGLLDDMLVRKANAKKGFLDYIKDQGFTAEEAAAICAVYAKLKVVEFGATDGQWRTKHGALLDRRCMENALKT
jgi:hypothetical protein